MGKGKGMVKEDSTDWNLQVECGPLDSLRKRGESLLEPMLFQVIKELQGRILCHLETNIQSPSPLGEEKAEVICP